MEQERIKKLAEWAGFRESGKQWILRQGVHSLTEIVYAEHELPNFTESLDAGFKWLVPPVLILISKQGYVPPIMKLFQLWYDELVSLTGDSSNVSQAALALCLAIEKLIDGGKEK